MSIFSDKYIEQAVETIWPIVHADKPNATKEEVMDIVSKLYKNKIKDPTVVMDNNVIKDTQTITLSKLCSWVEKENPVVCGNATFYCQPEVLKSPASQMLKSWKKERKAVKKKMFEYKAGSDEYAALDLEQSNLKIRMNAEYGASGAPTSAFYSKYSPPATTLMAQSIITTMAAFFEGFIGDNQYFFNVNECFDWMTKVCEKDDKIPKWIVRPTPDEVYKRIRAHFYKPNPDDWVYVEKYINTRSKDQLVYLYYANNFRDLIRNHKRIQDLLEQIMTKLPNYEGAIDEVPDPYKDKFKDAKDPVLEYNRWISKEMFLNPYEIPDVIKKEMEEFIGLMSQFVYVEYLTPDSIVKLNSGPKRKTVLLVDTDSNMLNSDQFVTFVIDDIFHGELFGRKRMYDDMILVNVLAATVDRSVASILDFYGRQHHMNKESRAELTMKNEFMFRRFFLMKVKKRYASSIVLREGNINIPPLVEIKGMDFIKAGVTEEVSKRFEKILCDRVLFSEEIDLHGMMDDLKRFEQDIRDDLAIGGTQYLKQEQFKAAEAYSKTKDANGNTISAAYRLPVFKATLVWNELFPDKKINNLDRVHILKLLATNLMDLEPIRYQYPREYEMLKEKIFNNPNPAFAQGMRYIAIPTSVSMIPEFLIPLIDVEILISNIMATFQSVLDVLNIEPVTFKTPNGIGNVNSCLVSF